MTDPTTPTQIYTIPNTGNDPGAWGPIINANFAAIDGSKGGAATISLTNANVTLSAPAGTVIPGAGPTQSQNARITFTGTLTGSCLITFPLPGFYIVKNNCTVGGFVVQAAAAAPGKLIGLPPGQCIHVFSDGTDMEFVNMPAVGSYMDYAGSSVPSWITGCSVPPWKVCDGSVLNIADWPQLYAIIGSSYGGNGLTTFALPDFRNRVMVPIDINQGGFSNRVTSAGSGINGQSLGAAGGDQLAQQHTHTYTEPNAGAGHAHNLLPNGNGVSLLETSAGGGNQYTGGGNAVFPGVTATQNSTTGITINNANGGAGQNMPPALIGGIRFIRMG